MKPQTKQKNHASVENVYQLNGRVPLGKAIPFGLQHVLAMFVSNLTPVLIVCSAALLRGTNQTLSSADITRLLQCAMFAAGIGTCLQLYPIWKIGSRLPIVMGVSFTFVTVLSTVAACSMTSKVMLFSSSTPSISLAIWRCPLLDTGRNSVMPCTMPSRMACSVSMYQYRFMMA